MNAKLMALAAVPNTWVRLLNETDLNSDLGKVRIHVHGKLEYEEEEKEFYVRINEDPHGHGCNGVGFFARNVVDAYKQPSGIWEIVLRG